MTGRALPPTSPFAGDDGAPDPALVAALRGVPGGPRTARVVEALAHARVLVPVLAELEVAGEGVGGLTVDKEASTGVVALRTPDGRTALPVFSGTAALSRWHEAARPVPAEGPRAAASALQEGWDLLVLDPGDPGAVVVPRPAVMALALGEAWHPAVVDGVVRSAVLVGIRAALTGLRDVGSVDAVPGTRAEVAVVLGLVPGLSRTALEATVAEVGDRLARDAVVTAEVDSLELTLRTLGG